jgi:cold shock CspA family protein
VPPRAAYPSAPPVRRGVASTGCITDLRTGQGHGFIRLAGGGEIYFHRSDLDKDTSFNDFAVGQTVTFELLEDRLSGARALRVKRRRRPH